MNIIHPRKALNKAWLKVKPVRSEIEIFKTNLIRLIDHIDNAKDEEYHKTEVRDFLRNTWYKDKYYFNVKQNIDWAICNGPKAGDPVGVLIETKKPANKAEMISRDNLNKKALHELILYYLRERITNNNLEVKHIIATNIYEWFIFDSSVFEKLFAENKTLVRLFKDFEEGRLAGNGTDFFYKKIAETEVGKILNSDAAGKLEYTWFDIRDYDRPLINKNKQDDNKLIVLFKLLSPEHLLKLPFANDSNSLDKAFYAELLHIIGLDETKEGNKKVIGRKPAGKRNAGSLLENAIVQLENLDKISRLPNPSQYGVNYEDRLFNVALELSITWVNRILFLKLLEAQLIAYHNGDKCYSFLNSEKIKDYDDLNSLFFSVLARLPENRLEQVRERFEHVPYLNSSLFEVSEIEDKTIVVSNLKDELTLPLLPSTVLKDAHGRRRTGSLNSLQYFFEFLDAYDFSSEGAEEIQEDNKTLINASVLGLIFEKINGYKDGSFFTPGFITMYMCRETIRRAVVEKFNEKKGWNCKDFNSLYDKIDDKQEANTIIDSLKICDPAVGSGHFLVSALNEIIAIKSELKILCDRQGRTLRDYHVEVVNDELAITDEDGKPFKYNPQNRESQRVQEALFHEKQTIIENCLFGVDINPNSVKICRLRLWIELLKHAYYIEEDMSSNSSPVCYAGIGGLRDEYLPVRQLQTLPNIDINIKCGNSLISRFDLDADISQALKKSKWTINMYNIAVQNYREARDKEQKHEMERLIDEIKSNFRIEVSKNSKEQRKLDKLGQELFQLTGKGRYGRSLMLFEQEEQYGKNKNLEKQRKEKIKKIEDEINRLSAKMEEIRTAQIYENAFEWRFEFPEVLDYDGNFKGFDVVIGNPPYIRQEEFSDLKPFLQSQYETFSGTADLYVYFVELGLKIAKKGGRFVYILSNKWMRAGYGLNLRRWIKKFTIDSIIDFGDLPVFEEATTYPCITFIRKFSAVSPLFKSAQVDTLKFNNSLDNYLAGRLVEVDQTLLSDAGWTLVDDRVQRLLEKIKKAGKPLGEYVQGKIFYGIKTGLNEAFEIDRNTRERLIQEDPKSEEIIKPFLAGRDIKRYQQPKSDKYLIFTRRGIEIDKYPAIYNYLRQYESQLSKRAGISKWYELQASPGDSERFEENKIMYPDISKTLNFVFDENSHYCINTVYNICSSSKGLLGFLNSKLFLFYFQNVSNSIRGGYFRFFSDYMEKTPIVNKLNLLEENVSQILALKKQNPNADTSALEAEIDLMVYKLYGLTWEEAKIVDPEFGMGKEEYESLGDISEVGG